jgi:5-methylcytosine-specific restriction endonuclease McrA
MSKGVKQYVVITEALAQASVCQLCEARIDLKAMHIDHIKDRSKGGVGSGENARPLHPYCDSTYKRYLETAGAAV